LPLQDGKLFFKYAVTNMADASELIMKRIFNTDVDWLVHHQANKRMVMLPPQNEFRRI
jgi:3-oxoacyl-[acyl-carrier-protein] synthase-3